MLIETPGGGGYGERSSPGREGTAEGWWRGSIALVPRPLHHALRVAVPLPVPGGFR